MPWSGINLLRSIQRLREPRKPGRESARESSQVVLAGSCSQVLIPAGMARKHHWRPATVTSSQRRLILEPGSSRSGSPVASAPAFRPACPQWVSNGLAALPPSLAGNTIRKRVQHVGTLPNGLESRLPPGERRAAKCEGESGVLRCGSTEVLPCTSTLVLASVVPKGISLTILYSIRHETLKKLKYPPSR
jgi:hypothetical protein